MENIYSIDAFKENGYKTIDLIAEFLSNTQNNKEIKTLPWREPQPHYEDWKADFRDQPNNDPIALFKKVMNQSVNIHSNKFMGHQIAVTPPVTFLSSMIVNVLNNGMGVYEMGMAGNCMEKVVIENIAAKIGYDQNASGFVVTGGTIGNMTSLLAARAVQTNVWMDGNENKKFAIIVSSEAHYSVDRAVKIMGWGADSIFKVPVNKDFQIDTNAVQQAYDNALCENRKVLCIVGCACVTASGSYDDLQFLGNFCKTNNLWFHVDGAHGGPVIYSQKFKHLVKGIAMADSVIIDFHKMMMTPSLSTVVIFKNGSDSYKTFSQKADYLWQDQKDHSWYNSGMKTIECTKSMSVLNVYTLFKTFGEKIFEENIDTLYDLAKTFASLLIQINKFQLACNPQSNIVCFRYSNSNADLNDINSWIRNEIITNGEFYIVQTNFDGKIFLRVSLMNPLTTEKDLKVLIEKIDLLASEFNSNPLHHKNKLTQI
ncbi:MAG: hypothetical protein NVSMB45_12890 [Ginsengibacter sp.]